MPSRLASRPAEAAAVDAFLRSARREPGALVIEGEPGIGKSTLLVAAVAQARAEGHRILMAHPAQAETVLAYAALTDLLGDIDDTAWRQLPPAQRRAVDRVMLWDDATAPATDQRAVAAACLTLVELLAERGPLLLVIDDAQWLDASSVHVIAFVARRLPAGARLLLSVRTGPDGESATDWLQLPTPDAVRRVRVRPLSLGALHAVVADRLGRSIPRPTMVRIREISGGNPFYAIELARALGDAARAETALPSTLAELVRDRLGELAPDLHGCLLATACLPAPTIELVARAVDRDPAEVVDLLQQAEGKGLVEVDGLTVRFTHPLLSHGVYTGAAPGSRRAMHRRLAGIVDQPELRARHLALGATTGDPAILSALDDAAESARSRGAPGAAAEFIDLAISLGGDTPERRIRSAALLFNAGDNTRARAVLEEAVARTAPGPVRAEGLSLLGVVLLFADSFVESAALLTDALAEVGDDLRVRVPMLITLAFALVNGGRMVDALARIGTAIEDASALGDGHLLSQALSMQAVLRFMAGEGYDAVTMLRALDLEDPDADTPVAFRPRAQYALLQAWIGDLDESRRVLAAIRARCLERGEESELIFIAFHQVMAEVWAGDLPAATLLVEDFYERALQLGTDLPLSVALTTRALVAAYTGRADDARADARAALAAGRRCGSTRLSEWPVTALGFLDVSLGDHRAALDTLTPLLVVPDMVPDATEVIGASFIPDAVEAMVGLGELDHADRLATMLQRNGSRLDRPWASAVGARCRAMVLAARGDVEAAADSAEAAMAHHDRLPMPFERARTQLLLGQLHRRRRHKDAAAATLKAALTTFEQLGTPLWAERARAELGRANVGPRRTGGLTPSEQRVAELAATGMTNREVAAALFISPKTVEANLARIYRKLGIRSRAELGRLTPPD